MQVSEKTALVGVKSRHRRPAPGPKVESPSSDLPKDTLDIEFPKQNKPEGNLHILDLFSKTGTPEHGNFVAAAAEQSGFQGQTVAWDINQWDNKDFSRFRKADQEFAAVKLDKKESLRALNDLLEGNATGQIRQETQFLKALSSQGTQNSAVNLSLGVSKANRSFKLYTDSFDNLDPKYASLLPAESVAKSRTRVHNLATAFDLDSTLLLNPDPKVHGPERHKLQQNLIDHTSKLFDGSETLSTARSEWASAVTKFESKNNSVVMSSGNFGELEQGFQVRNPGYSLDFPEDFKANIVDTPGVTLVGASNDKKTPAAYSGFTRTSQVYANGNIGPVDGTSFAAPKVAGAVSWAHGAHPGSSSKNVDGFLQHNLFEPVPTSGGTIQVFSPHKFKKLQEIKAQDDWQKSSPTYFL